MPAFSGSVEAFPASRADRGHAPEPGWARRPTIALRNAPDNPALATELAAVATAPIAAEAVRRIDQLFAIERDINGKRLYLTADERGAFLPLPSSRPGRCGS